MSQPYPSSSSLHQLSPLSLLLYRQRSQDPEFCDVLLRCGVEVSQVHGCVLAARSDVLERVLKQLTATGRPAQVQLDVDGLFVGVEHLFQDVVTYLYLGQRPANATDDEMTTVQKRLGIKVDQQARTGEQQLCSLADILVTPAATDAVIKQPPTAFVANETAPIEAKTEGDDEVPMDYSICHKCDLLFISKDEYLAHQEHNCAKKFTCKSCGAMFTRVQSMLEHLLEVRHGETVCSLCDHVTLSSTEMEAHFHDHLRTPGKPYVCLQCDSRYASRNGLLMHIPKHSAETPFVCPICSKGFKWKHALTAHTVIHATSKKYLCQECGFTTSHTSVLKRHRRIHSGQTLKCALPDCTFETVRKQNLVQHQLTHSKEKPHQCEVCGKSFSLVKNMRRHALQHDYNALKYQCKVKNCQFGTIRSDKFIEHMRRHHPEEQERPSRVTALARDPLALAALTTTTTISGVETDHVTSATAAAAVVVVDDSIEPSPAMADASSSATPTLVGGVRIKLPKNPFDTISPPNRTISNYDSSTFTGVVTSSQQNFVLSDVALSQAEEVGDSRGGGNRAAAEAAAHAAVVESTLNTMDDLV